jgi:hypothetical protein
MIRIGGHFAGLVQSFLVVVEKHAEEIVAVIDPRPFAIEPTHPVSSAATTRCRLLTTPPILCSASSCPTVRSHSTAQLIITALLLGGIMPLLLSAGRC